MDANFVIYSVIMAGCATTSIHADYDAFRGFDANQRQEDSSGAQLYIYTGVIGSLLSANN